VQFVFAGLSDNVLKARIK